LALRPGNLTDRRFANAGRYYTGGDLRFREREPDGSIAVLPRYRIFPCHGFGNGNADLMMTDSSEVRYQQKLHAGVLCAVHPEKPLDFAEKAYWLQRDVALKAFVDQWLHIALEDGSFKRVYAAWFE
jgi:cyclohexadienyl dehydratase